MSTMNKIFRMRTFLDDKYRYSNIHKTRKSQTKKYRNKSEKQKNFAKTSRQKNINNKKANKVYKKERWQTLK